MDARETIPRGGSFYPLVMDLFQKKEKVSMLYDDNGVTRANGFIEDVFEKEGVQWLKLDNQTEIRIDKLYALNGTFSSDYSEC